MKKLSGRFLLSVGIVAGCVACQDNDVKPVEAPPSTKLDGTYDVISITCDYPIDLDRDGNPSFDLLAETHEASHTSRYYLEFKTEIYDRDPDPDFYDQEIDLWIPFTNVFKDASGDFLDVKYGFTNLLARYRYDETTGNVSILRNLGNGEVVSGHVISEDTLSMQFKAYFYSTKGWETLPLNGIYKRRP
ncbi:hypothetical protein [Chryseolinea soli]|uniref:Lipoprotein n=1 Tax=Chryseolinea soli TaxID=2321403 RepID=A0A385SX68_9BACT|nr:hypothetical protein [Chryseolinea soli]AYB34320.1 hypothetical protein D4L85_28740 [Chryseolinea soli]